jgi:uncharacterized membrane protein YgcG
MKKFSKILAVIFAFLLVGAFAVPAFADEFDDDYYDETYDYDYDYSQSESYYIQNYDVNMKVNENNSIDVVENIKAYFNVEKHGIYRYIPIENNIQRSDGSSATVKSKIKNLDVDDNYETYTESNNFVIKIGDADEELIGEKDYTISYTYYIGKDINENFDELYYNIIGDGWDAEIQNVSFSIEMPKDFDESKIGFSSGDYGTEGNNNVKYEVNNNVISGSLLTSLDRYQALTVRIELDDGYFTFNMAAYVLRLLVIVIPSVITLCIVILLWAKYGKDKKIVDVVEFYPPENMNSAEVALWFNGISTAQDTIAMLIELANEGYLRISEENVKTFLNHSRKEFKIEKLKSVYDGHDGLKHKFFNGLFKSGKRDSVYLSDLEDEFYKTADDIVSELNAKKEEIFHSNSLKLRFVGWALSIISAVIAFYATVNILGGSEKYTLCLISITICIISFVLSFFIRRRTDEGHDYKQKINGFKIFLETAEKEKLETLVEENPQYFYNILPFAYVLGVSDKWIKNFEGIVIQKPNWYNTPSFTPMTMHYFMHTAMPMAQSIMTSRPQNSGGGSSGGGMSFGGGGGGFAGGGFGGGGGGSW